MSLNSNLGISDARAKEISKQYAALTMPLFEKGQLSGSGSIETIMGMDLTEIERIWLAYHVGGINTILLHGNAKEITINW